VVVAKGNNKTKDPRNSKSRNDADYELREWNGITYQVCDIEAVHHAIKDEYYRITAKNSHE